MTSDPPGHRHIVGYTNPGSSIVAAHTPGRTTRRIGLPVDGQREGEECVSADRIAAVGRAAAGMTEYGTCSCSQMYVARRRNAAEIGLAEAGRTACRRTMDPGAVYMTLAALGRCNPRSVRYLSTRSFGPAIQKVSPYERPWAI